MENCKIGVGITTYNRLGYLRGLIHSLVPCEKYIDELIVVNDGGETPNWDLPYGKWIDNEHNMGVGKSKNKALKYLHEAGCKYMFLIEDDVKILDTQVFKKYIEASKRSNIQHFNFAFHGLDNYHNGLPAIKLKVEYSPTVAVCLYPNVYGAFSFYTKKCIDEVGYMDEYYYNAMEHVDHTMEIIKAGMHPPFRWFADIADSNLYIQEQDEGHEQSEIRRDSSWIKNFHNAADYFAQKQGFDVRSPQQLVASKQETLAFLKLIK